jgi:hypothetical protein
MLRGITGELYGRGKDLNAFNREDFKNVLKYLKDTKKGTVFQRWWGDVSPEIRKRYYWMMPEAVDREMMRYDIDWIKENAYFITKEGKGKLGVVRRPTYHLSTLMKNANDFGGMAVSVSDRFIGENNKDFFYLQELKEGEGLFSFSVLSREMGMLKIIDARKDLTAPVKEHYKNSYREAFRDIKKEINWEKLKDKEFTVNNDAGKRVKVTGNDIVHGNDAKNLTGIKNRLNSRMEGLHKYIVGDIPWMEKMGYKLSGKGSFFGEEKDNQHRMNWRKFINDVNEMKRRGDEKGIHTIMEKVGIDGMRHISRSMLFDLASNDINPSTGKTYKQGFANWKIFNTGKIDFKAYFPHMFFDRKMAEKAMINAIKRINSDPNMPDNLKKLEIQKLTHRHKALTGDWEFQDMQTWDSIDQISVIEAQKSIAKSKEAKRESIKGLNPNDKFGSMMSRSGHIPGWATDITAVEAYMRNVSNTFFRQMQQVTSRDVIETAYKNMSKKFGKDFALNWRRFYELYAQGAMGSPDVIPERIYEDERNSLCLVC